MHSPDIRDIRMPRPNANYCASVRSKMSLSLLKDNDNERLDDSLEPSPPKHSDIRNKLGLEPTMRMTAGKLINTDIWAGKVRTPGEAFIDPVFVNPWIEDYVENQTDYDVRANFLYEVDSVIHCHSDVDTYSGELLKPYQHDYTVPDYMNSESQDRQMTATASLFVKRNALNANPRKDRQGPARSRPGRYHAPMPLHIATPVVQAEREPSPPVTRARGDSDPYPFAPCIPCHVRPAAREDMEGVRTIYNFEVVNGIQALDTEPLSLSNWHGILDKTRDVKLPFVVVVGGTYHVLTSLSHDKKESSLDADLAGKILAFGFLTVRQPGLAGSFSGSSRMSAKAHVFVHPDYRRKKLGHVCLDKLMSTVSTRYSTKPGYEFVNCDDNPTYKFPRHHDRKFYAVFIDYFVPRSRELGAAKFLPDETELKWFEQVITSRYGFRKVGQLVAANRSRRTYEPSPVWLDTVMFEHLCQENMGFTYVL
jgi:GNAT superfamily N-acetyltransferase